MSERLIRIRRKQIATEIEVATAVRVYVWQTVPNLPRRPPPLSGGALAGFYLSRPCPRRTGRSCLTASDPSRRGVGGR